MDDARPVVVCKTGSRLFRTLVLKRQRAAHEEKMAGGAATGARARVLDSHGLADNREPSCHDREPQAVVYGNGMFSTSTIWVRATSSRCLACAVVSFRNACNDASRGSRCLH